MARAGVVICPPLAVESTCAQPTLQILSTQLATQGCAVLRFDYAGTGDSAGSDDGPGRVAGWKASVRAAVEFIRTTGCSHVVVVGLRLGATLASAELAAGDGADAVVLWDPYPTGRSFARQQGMMAKVTGWDIQRDDGAMEGPGIVLSAETVSELTDLKLQLDDSVADRLFVLTRSGRVIPAEMKAILDRENVDWEEIDGQESLVDVDPVFAVTPQQTLEMIVKWIHGTVGGKAESVLIPQSTGAVVGHDQHGRSIHEYPVLLGPNALFGIETVPEVDEGKPPVLFLNAGVIDHVGPARVWVTLARALAARGFRTVRFDLSGVGATALRPGAHHQSTVTLIGIEDVADAQRAVSPDDPSAVVLVGLCSGGYHSSEAALSTGARGVVMINPSFKLIGVEDEVRDQVTAEELQRQVDEAPRAWVKRVPGRAMLWELVRRAPDPFWAFLNRFAIQHPPAETLKQMRASGTDVFVACDGYDAWVLQRGAHRELARTVHNGRIRIEVVPDMDHTLFYQKGRERTIPLVVEHLTSRF
jgi:pimeloyl-ACP methyl ester carboxylesterase